MRASGDPQGRAVSRDRPDAYVPIDDYAAVGDCRTLALVSRGASIDWWCPPRFDAPSLFGRVLGLPGGTERTLDDVEGYRGSPPVRIGNGATWQRQLDIYGEVLGAAYLDLRAGNEVSEHNWHILARMADLARHRWRRPDTSIWEVRGG